VRRKRLRLASGELIEGPPKSEAGRRTVALPPLVVAALERHLAEYTGEGRDDLVLPRQGAEPSSGRISETGSGALRRRVSGWMGCGSTICATSPGPCPLAPERRRKS
jgi:hypothetical protein